MGAKSTHWCSNPIKNKHYADYKSVIFNDRKEPRYKCKICGKTYSSQDLGLTTKQGQYKPSRKIPSSSELYKKVLRCLTKEEIEARTTRDVF